MSRLSMERVFAALLLAALLFATCVNNSSADKPFPGRRLSVHIDPMLLKINIRAYYASN